MSFGAFGLGALSAFAALAGLGVLVLYMLRRTPKPQLVSNVAFWIRAAESSRPRFLRAARIPWVAFLISLLVALLFVFEIGDPRFGKSVGGTTVIVLAAGRSMAVDEGAGPRIDRARRELRRWVDRTTLGGQVAVVRAGMLPETLLPLTEEPGDLERALEGFSLDDGPADLTSALALADRIVAQSGAPGQILLISDRDVEHETLAPRVLVPVGLPADTLAITELTARRNPLAAGEYGVHVTVRSFTSRRASARLTILDGETALLDRRVDLAPGQGVEIEARGFSSARAELRARLEEIQVAGGRDALALDDVAFATVEPLAPLRVLLVTSGNRYLEAALAVHPSAIVTRTDSAELYRRAAEAIDAFDVWVLDGVAPPQGVTPPSLVLLSPPAGPLRVVGPAERPRLTAVLGSHPVMNDLRFENARLHRASRLGVEPGDQVLMRSGADALGVARETAELRWVAFGLDLGATDIVERDTFPLLIHHALGWAAGGRAELPLSRRLGEALPAPASAIVLGPDGEPVDASERAMIRRQGIYHVGERAIAFSGAEHASAPSAGAAGGRFRQRTPLPPLALLAAAALLFFMLVEWGLLHRGRLG